LSNENSGALVVAEDKAIDVEALGNGFEKWNKA